MGEGEIVSEMIFISKVIGGKKGCKCYDKMPTFTNKIILELDTTEYKCTDCGGEWEYELKEPDANENTNPKTAIRKP